MLICQVFSSLLGHLHFFFAFSPSLLWKLFFWITRYHMRAHWNQYLMRAHRNQYRMRVRWSPYRTRVCLRVHLRFLTPHVGLEKEMHLRAPVFHFYFRRSFVWVFVCVKGSCESCICTHENAGFFFLTFAFLGLPSPAYFLGISISVLCMQHLCKNISVSLHQNWNQNLLSPLHSATHLTQQTLFLDINLMSMHPGQEVDNDA